MKNNENLLISALKANLYQYVVLASALGEEKTKEVAKSFENSLQNENNVVSLQSENNEQGESN